MSGDPYIKENERLEAEIARLQDWKRKQMEDIMTLGQQVGKLEIELKKEEKFTMAAMDKAKAYQAALETIRMICANFPGGGRETITAIDDRARRALAKEGK